MSQTKFTSGEWNVGMSRGSYSVSSLMETNKSSRVCDLDYYGNNKANANLIAAAPDMYAEIELEIKELEFRLENSALDECERWDIPEAIKRKTALLKKARGE